MTPESEASDGGPKADPKRYIMLAMYCLLSLTNSNNWVSFAPISDQTGQYFQTSNNAVNMLALIFSILYGPGSVVGVLWFQKYKLRDTLILGGAFSVSGCLVRVIAALLRDIIGGDACYSLFLLGQGLIGMGQPILVNLATAISSTWFPLEERDRATTIATLFNPLGNAVGAIVPPMLVHSTGDDDNDSYREIHGMNMLMIVEFFMALVPFITAIAFFEARPATPPSYSEAFRDDLQHEVLAGAPRVRRHSSASTAEGMRERSSSRGSISIPVDDKNSLSLARAIAEFKELMKNKQYLLLLTSFSFGLGLINSVLTLIFQLVEPYGYSNNDAGLFSFILIVSGMFGAAVMAYILETTRAYRTVYSYCFVMCLVTVFFFTSMLYHNNFNMLCVAFVIMGITVVPLFPACLENVAECTYPISEDMSVGIILTTGNISSVVITLILAVMIGLGEYGAPPLTYSNTFIWIWLSLAVMVAVLYKGDNKRLAADLKHCASNGEGFEKSSSTADLLSSNDKKARYSETKSPLVSPLLED